MPLPNRIAAGIAMALAFTPFAARAQDLREARLSNGLRVIVRESFEKDLVGLALAVDGGNRTEPRELSGLSHYYEHLVFRGGTRRQAELETRKAFFALGEFSGFTTADYTDYDFLVPAANFDEALWRFADAILHLDVTAEKVAKEREVVLSEFKMSYADSPPGWAWYNLARAAFRRHPYGRTTIGLREVVESAGIEQLQRFYAERYVPNHMVLAIAGAIPAEAAFEKVRAAFGAAQPGAPSFETGEAEPPQEGPRAVVEAREAEKSYIAVGWKAPGVLSPHADGLRVLAEVLGGGRASRLEREVRARRGLALEVGAWWSETKDPWLFEAAMTVEPGREVAALEALVDEARRLREADVPAEELEDAKNALATAFTFDDESPLSQARTIARCAVLGDVRLARERAARIRSVTAADVRAAARAVFEAAGATVSIVRPERSGEAPAEAALLAALSRTEAAKEPPPGPRPRRTLARVLACGVRAVVREDFSAPIVAASFEAPAPLLAEPPGKPGTAALATRLFLRGAGPLSREEIARRIQALGVRLEAALDRDALSLTLESPAARAAEALDLFGLVALEPRFEDDEVEKARKEQVAAVQAIDDSSFDLVEREFYAALYEPSSIYGRPLEGTEAALATVTREDLLSWHRAAFSARFPVVALAGAIEAERALDLLDKALRRGPRAVPVAPPGERVTASGLLEGALPQLATPRAAPAREKLVKRKREQVAFRLGEVGIAASDPDFVPLSIAVRHLASDLFFRHVYEEGVAYRAWTYLRAGAGPHPFTFEMGVSAPNFRKVRASLEGALADLRERGLATGEVARAKREMIQRHVLAQRTDLALASMLARYETIGLGWEYADRFPALIEKTSVEEVNAAVRRHLDPQKLVIVAVGEF